MSKRGKRPKDLLDTPVTLPSGALFHTLMAAADWLKATDTMLDHVRRTGRLSCEDDELADAAETLALAERAELVRRATHASAQAFPPRVWRHILDTMTYDEADEDPAAEPAPLTGKAALDLADLLNGEQP